jgi:hypothetical protein
VDFGLQNTCAGSSLTVSNSNNDGSGSLRRAIANICPGGTIDFAANYTIHLASPLEIDKDMTIDGTGVAVTISGDSDNDGTGNVRVFNVGGHFNLNNLTVSWGYDTAINNDGSLTITNSTFSNNTAGYGGVFANYGTLSIANSTFVNNAATTGGGVLYNQSEATITNSTISSNSGGLYGGAIASYSGSVTLRNTIVANSSSGDNCVGTITDGGGNLVWGDSTCPGINADPKLGTLAGNGGYTQTLALLTDSAAIEAGSDAIC